MADVISGQFSERVVETYFARDGFYQLTSDGTTVIYSGIDESGGDPLPQQLYSVKVDGTAPRQLTNFTRDGRVVRFKVTGDSQRVVFVSSTGLYSVSLAGGIPIQLDNPPTQRAHRFVISNDSSYVVFNNFGGIFSVPIEGGSINFLSDTEYPSQTDPSNPRISSDDEYVVFARQEILENGSSTVHILSTPITGGELNELLPTDEGLQDTFINRIDPSGNYLIYLSARNEQQIFSVPIGGGSRIPLSGTYNFDHILSFLISPDGQNLIYSVKSIAGSEDDKSFLVPVTGGDAVQIDSGFAEGSKLCGTTFTPDSSKFVFCRGANSQGGGKVFAANVDEPLSRISLNGGMTVAGFGSGLRFTEDSQNILLASVIPVDGNFDHQLTSLPIAGGPEQTVFKFRLPTSNNPCFNNIDFTLDNSMFSDCHASFNFDRVSLIVQNIYEDESIELDANDPQNRESLYFHAITNDGLNVVYLVFFENEDVFKILSASTVQSEETLCFPIGGNTSIAVVCL